MPTTIASNHDLPHEQAFAGYAYVFMTFLYAAAVHLIIATAHEARIAGIASYGLEVLLIFFIFSDWTSRARLPRLLPETPSGYVQVGKALLEIIGVFFLVTGFLLFISGPHDSPASGMDSPTPALAFGFFLIATAGWDYLMVYVMDDLDLRPLARSVWITGAAIDMTPTRIKYLGRFDAWKAGRAVAIQEELDAATAKVDGDPAHGSRHLFVGGIRAGRKQFHLRFFEAALASLTQFLAGHVLFANGVAGVTLVITASWLHRTPLDAILGRSMTPLYGSLELRPVVAAIVTSVALIACACLPLRRSIGLLIAACIAGLGIVSLVAPATVEWLSLSAIIATIFLVSTFFYLFRSTRHGTYANWLGGIAIALPLVLLYLLLPWRLLIGLLAAQQVLANAFLQVGASGPPRPEEEPAGGIIAANEPVPLSPAAVDAKR